eukprot:6032642-Prymnesium_polylepis.1
MAAKSASRLAMETPNRSSLHGLGHDTMSGTPRALISPSGRRSHCGSPSRRLSQNSCGYGAIVSSMDATCLLSQLRRSKAELFSEWSCVYRYLPIVCVHG